MYIERTEYFNDLKIRMRIDISGRFADIFADENFYKANGLSGSKEMAYKLGFSAEQIRHSERYLPRWIRFYESGIVGESPFAD